MNASFQNSCNQYVLPREFLECWVKDAAFCEVQLGRLNFADAVRMMALKQKPLSPNWLIAIVHVQQKTTHIYELLNMRRSHGFQKARDHGESLSDVIGSAIVDSVCWMSRRRRTICLCHRKSRDVTTNCASNGNQLLTKLRRLSTALTQRDLYPPRQSL